MTSHGACLVLALVSAGLAAQETGGPEGWYLGGELGRVSLRIPGRNVQMEGIQFTNVNASSDRPP